MLTRLNDRLPLSNYFHELSIESLQSLIPTASIKTLTKKRDLFINSLLDEVEKNNAMKHRKCDYDNPRNKNFFTISTKQIQKKCGTIKVNGKVESVYHVFMKHSNVLTVVSHGYHINEDTKELSLFMGTKAFNQWVCDVAKHFSSINDDVFKVSRVYISLSDYHKAQYKSASRGIDHFVNEVFPEFMNVDGVKMMDVPVDINSMNLALHNTKNVRDLIQIMVFIEAATIFGGVIPHIFVPNKTGRLFAKGSVNLQSCSKEVRQICLGSYHDYDMEAACYSIIKGMVKDVMDTPTLDQYLSDKSRIRQLIAKDVFGCKNLPAPQSDVVKTIKVAFTSIGFGARANTSIWKNKITNKLAYASLVEIFSKNGNIKQGKIFADRFIKQTFVKNFMVEWREVMTFINDQVNVGDVFGGYTCNETSKSKKTAHVFQTLERIILDLFIGYFGKKVLLPMHDGFATDGKLDDNDVRIVLNGVKEQYGITMKMSHDTYVNGSKVNEYSQVIG